MTPFENAGPVLLAVSGFAFLLVLVDALVSLFEKEAARQDARRQRARRHEPLP